MMLTLKKKLLRDPVQTIENFLGKKLNLPKGKTLEVIDYSDESKYYFEIPKPVKMSEEVELTEEQLELVAGGGSPYIVSCWDDGSGSCGGVNDGMQDWKDLITI